MLVTVTTLLASCGGSADGPTVPAAEPMTSPAAQTGAAEVVAAARPAEFTFEQELVGIDPCSGLEHVLTINSTCRQTLGNGAGVLTCKREITTDPTGYVGRGSLNQVVNDEILNLTFTDIMKNDDGDRVRGRAHGLFDLSTGTVRIDFFEAV